MDCVNHSGINATAYCQSWRQGALHRLRAHRGGRTSSLRAMLDGMAELSQPFIPPVASGPTPQLPRRWE